MYGEMTESGAYKVSVACNSECECSVSRMQPICSKDGVTNFYSPCHAGCEAKESIPDLGDPAKNTTLYSSCKCVKQATEERNTSISRPWVNRELLVKHNIEYPALDLVDRIHRWT